MDAGVFIITRPVGRRTGFRRTVAGRTAKELTSMRKVVQTSAVLIALLAAMTAAGSAQAALIRTFDFEGADAGLTLTGSPILSTEHAVTGSQSVKMPSGSVYGVDNIDMLPGLANTNIGTVVMRVYVEGSGEGNVNDNVQTTFFENPAYDCLALNHGWPISGELGYHTYYSSSSSPHWLTTGKALSTDAWYTVAVAFNGVYGGNPVVSIWAAQGTEVTPADLVVDQTPFNLEAFSFDNLNVTGTGGTAFYIDNLQIYDTYGEGIVPEPGSFMLLVSGLCGLCFTVWRHRR